MKVRFWLPGPLISLAGGHRQVVVDSAGETLGDALDGLFAKYPGVHDRILTEQGAIREHVNVFVGDREARSAGGSTMPVAEGMEISIIPAISGG